MEHEAGEEATAAEAIEVGGDGTVGVQEPNVGIEVRCDDNCVPSLASAGTASPSMIAKRFARRARAASGEANRGSRLWRRITSVASKWVASLPSRPSSGNSA